MKPTPHEDINTLLSVIVTRIRSVFGDTLVGLYLYGSLASGDFDPDISDIDLLAVTSRTLSKRQYEALKTMHADLAHQYPKWNDRIEVQYASVSGLQTLKTKISTIATISPGEPIHFIKAGKDWLLNWYEIQEKGMTLFGVHHRFVIPSISKSEYVNALKDSALYWRERIKAYTDQSSRGSGAYIVLTMCRMLYGYSYGKQASKAQAAAWAADAYPQWAGLITNALSWRREQWQKEQKRIGPKIAKIRRLVKFASHHIQINNHAT